ATVPMYRSICLLLTLQSLFPWGISDRLLLATPLLCCSKRSAIVRLKSIISATGELSSENCSLPTANGEMKSKSAKRLLRHYCSFTSVSMKKRKKILPSMMKEELRSKHLKKETKMHFRFGNGLKRNH